MTSGHPPKTITSRSASHSQGVTLIGQSASVAQDTRHSHHPRHHSRRHSRESDLSQIIQAVVQLEGLLLEVHEEEILPWRVELLILNDGLYQTGHLLCTKVSIC